MNRWVLSQDLKREIESVLQRSGGSECHSWGGAGRLKALLSVVVKRAEGTVRRTDGWGGSEGTGRLENMEEICMVQGVRLWIALWVINNFLYWMQTVTESQWSCWRTGMMWQVDGVLMITHAAEFWTSWSLWIFYFLRETKLMNSQ